MSQTMPLLFASILIHSGGGPVTGFGIILFLLVVGTMVLVAICWGFVEEKIERTRGRHWPTVSAVVDVVSVAFIEDNAIRFNPNLHFPRYKATLTYTYNDPEQQMGDYSRDFANEDDAMAWVNSYKGETVKVHVNPSDPTRSVLREEDL